MTREDFLAEAEAFAQRRRRHPAVVLLRIFFNCNQREFDQLIRAVYCASLPSNAIPIIESIPRTLFGLIGMPALYLLSKKWAWRPEPPSDYNLETIDPHYFERWFSRIFNLLPGSKRLSPREPGGFSRADLTLPCHASVLVGDLLRLGALIPLMVPALGALSWVEGLNLLKTFRQAIATYLIHRGYFRRYPCRHFITFDDYPNHPARYIAFRQLCPGDLMVIQNGERGHFPQFAFGLLDRYFVFGKKSIELMRGLKVQAGRFDPVGALCLNYHHGLFVQENSSGPPALRYDILFIDQGIYPHNGTPSYFGEAILRLLGNLKEFGQKHPSLHLFYQLRPYGPDERHKVAAVEELLRTRYPETFTVLENRGDGESYRNILHANLTVTFESTLGFEALMMGKKALFVNYSGIPGETLCGDPRFQIEDPRADYDNFERRVLELLKLELPEIPETAIEHHHAFDGRVQERILALLLNGSAPH